MFNLRERLATRLTAHCGDFLWVFRFQMLPQQCIGVKLDVAMAAKSLVDQSDVSVQKVFLEKLLGAGFALERLDSIVHCLHVIEE